MVRFMLWGNFLLFANYLIYRSTAAYQKYCALFDKSTKIGTHVDYYLLIIFGYGGAHNCTRSSHSNSL